jgi:hypothetical protein
MKRVLLRPATAGVLGVLGVLAGMAAGQATDPYAVTPEAGPWVICVTSYMGEEAPGLARQLVEQLRRDHHMAAYVFDRGDAEKKEWEAYLKLSATPGVENPRVRHVRYTQNCAVLIGGFKDFDAANTALAGVKALPEPNLKLSTGQKAEDVVLSITPDADGKRAEKKHVAVNPFPTSFVTPNPTVSTQKAVAKPDPIWKELNAAETYSLLKNPKPWTLVVKNYPGATVLQQGQEKTSLWDQVIKMGSKPGASITAAGYQAHQLAEFLRDKRVGGLDAYVLHTRTSSVVTVGGFDSIDDPRMQQMKRQLERMSFKADPRVAGNLGIKGDPIGLMRDPLPMQVPHF